MVRGASAFLVSVCLGVSATGCGLILGISSWQDVSCVDNCSGTDSATDSTMPLPEGGGDTGRANADASDSGMLSDVLDSGVTEAEAASPYLSVTDGTNWTRFDISTLDGGPKGFAGGAFDGRYVYLAPYNKGSPDGLVTRYDTQSGDAGFTARSSWQIFDTTTITNSIDGGSGDGGSSEGGDGGSGAAGFQGAVYDATHHQVYFVPSNDGTPDGIVAAYTTTKPFTQASSWQTYAPHLADGGAAGFAGGVMAGNSLVLIPSNNGAPDGITVQYDSAQPFTAPAAWSAFDLTAVKATDKGYFGGVDTGPGGLYVIFAPLGFLAPSGLVTAHIKSQPFTSAANTSWQTYDIAALTGGGNAVGFRGAAFDGVQYVYLVPGTNGVAAQYDIRQSFTSPSGDPGWAFSPDLTKPPFDARAKGFCGAAFDGRYLYLIPNASTLLARYDTTGPFADPTSWVTYDTTTGPFTGAVFDGEYIYLVPGTNGTTTNGVMARFHARSPAAQVPGLSGSFF